MNCRNTNWLIVIVILLIFASWITFSNDIVIFGRDIKLNLGLDLQGGLQALLEADLPQTDNDPIRGSGDHPPNP